MTMQSECSVASDQLLTRGLVYQLLARVYRQEPDQELFTRLGSEEILHILKKISPRLDISAFRAPPPSRIEDLSVEFCRLFIGPGPSVPPYESIHRTEPGNAGKFWGDATVEFKSLVEALGLHYAADFHEMPDHISVEFELMFRLLNAEAEALESGDEETRDNAREAQGVLLNRHVGVWLPRFCDRLEAATHDPFYAAIAVLTRDFMASVALDLSKVIRDGAEVSCPIR